MDKPSIKLGVVEPKDAIAAFTDRGLLQPTFRWQDVWQHEHDSRFAVAGVQREDVLAIFRKALEAKFAEGTSLREFVKTVRPALAAQGFWGDVEVTDPTTGEKRITKFDDKRLRLIFDTNVRQSYMAGKRRSILLHNPKQLVCYLTQNDAYVRPQHAAWHNIVLPADDPWWDTHWPLNGWGCRCDVQPINQRSIDRLRPVLKARGEADFKYEAPPIQWLPYVNPYTGEVKAVPRGIDPGFGHAPGAAQRDRDVDELVVAKAARSEAFSGAVMAAQAATDLPALMRARGERFTQFVAAAQASNPSGALFALAPVPPPLLKHLQTTGVPLQSGFVSIADQVASAITTGASVAAVDLPAALVPELPALLAAPTAILRITASGDLVYVIDSSPARSQRLFVTVSPTPGVQLDAATPGATTPPRNLVRAVSPKAPAEPFTTEFGAYTP